MYRTLQQQTTDVNRSDGIHRNHMAVNVLSAVGFDISDIRRALPKLTGLSHLSVANKLGVSRQSVCHAMNAVRSNSDLMAGVADAYNVPLEVLFSDHLQCKC